MCLLSPALFGSCAGCKGTPKANPLRGLQIRHPNGHNQHSECFTGELVTPKNGCCVSPLSSPVLGYCGEGKEGPTLKKTNAISLPVNMEPEKKVQVWSVSLCQGTRFRRWTVPSARRWWTASGSPSRRKTQNVFRICFYFWRGDWSQMCLCVVMFMYLCLGGMESGLTIQKLPSLLGFLRVHQLGPAKLPCQLV